MQIKLDKIFKAFSDFFAPAADDRPILTVAQAEIEAARGTPHLVFAKDLTSQECTKLNDYAGDCGGIIVHTLPDGQVVFADAHISRSHRVGAGLHLHQYNGYGLGYYMFPFAIHPAVPLCDILPRLNKNAPRARNAL